MSIKNSKAREIEELARQGICDIKPCCCDSCYPCEYERIEEAKEIANAKSHERQLDSRGPPRCLMEGCGPPPCIPCI